MYYAPHLKEKGIYEQQDTLFEQNAAGAFCNLQVIMKALASLILILIVLPGKGIDSGNGIRQFGFLTITARDSLTEDQITFLAKTYSIITLNKYPGVNDRLPVMQEISRLAEKLKSLNPDIQVLCYLNSVIAVPGSPPTNGFLKHPEWALKDTAGKPILIRNLKNYDMRNPVVREYWSESCLEMVSHPSIDGVFVDAIPKFGMRNHPDTRDALTGSNSDALSHGAYELLRQTREVLGPDKLMIFNGIRGDTAGWADGGMKYLDHTSGCLVEHFCAFTTRDPETGRLKKEMVAKDIELIRKASEMGKLVLVKGWPGNWSWLSAGFRELPLSDRKAIGEKHLDFSLAAYLIAAGRNCYFEYSYGYRFDGGIFDHYKLLDRATGQALGAAVRKGYTYTRAYANCTVRLDLENEEAEINWKSK